MVDLQAVGFAADHAGSVALVDEGSESAPFPAAPDLSSLLPGVLLVAFPPAPPAWPPVALRAGVDGGPALRA
jgi:hypothetical protein